MDLKAKKELLKNVELLGKKAYKDLALSKVEADGLLDYIDRAGLLTSRSIKIKNFIKYLESLIYTKKEEVKKVVKKKIEEEVATQQIFNILENIEEKEEEVKKEEPRKVANKKRVAKKVTTKKVPAKKIAEKKEEEVKKVEEVKKAPAKRVKAETKPATKKDASKKPLTEKEKQKLYKRNYRQEFIKALGNPARRKQINNFIKNEILSEDIDKYFNVSNFTINDIGLQMMHNRANFFLETEYGVERVTVIDRDYRDGRKYVLVKNLDLSKYDIVFVDTFNIKDGTFHHKLANGEILKMKFHIPVLKKNANIDY